MIVKFTVVWPLGTKSDFGTTADGSLLARVTGIPFLPAGLLMVTVPVDVVPPGTEVGFKLIPTKLGGLMVSEAT